MRRSLLVLLVVAALPLAGCAQTSSSSTKFSGTEGDVAKAVSDLQAAGQRKDSGKLCTQVLAKALVDKLDQGSSCKSEADKAIADSDDFTLSVRDVKVDGSNATATVREGSDGPTKTLQLVREANRWKISSLG